MRIPATFFSLLVLLLSGLALAGDQGKAPLPPGLYLNGDPGLNPALELVRAARQSIDIEIYEMEDSAFLESVRAAVRRGVKVRIIKDPYPVPKPDQCTWFPGLRERENWLPDPKALDETNAQSMPSCRASALPMIEEIRASGGKVEPFYKPHLCGQDENPNNDGTFCYEHGKLIIVDGATALMSTGNFNPGNFCDRAEDPSSCNRDFSYVTVDSAQVGLLRSVFENDLQGARYPLHPLVDSRTSQAPTITVSPYSLSPLVDFIRTRGMGKGHRIQVANQYLKERNLNAAIQAAARSGATVEVMVSSLCSFGAPKEEFKQKELDLYNSFAGAGVQYRYFPSAIQVWGRKGYLHAKAIVIDGKYAWMGSVNGSVSGLNTNREFGIFFEDPASVSALSEQLSRDFHDPNAETFEQSWACALDTPLKE